MILVKEFNTPFSETNRTRNEIEDVKNTISQLDFVVISRAFYPTAEHTLQLDYIVGH